MALTDKVDAFFVTNHNTLKDKAGRVVDPLEVGAWYLGHIRKPECTDERQFVQEGMLCACDDSGYNQGYEAMKVAFRILKQGEHPSAIVVKAPPRGPFLVNRRTHRRWGSSSGKTREWKNPSNNHWPWNGRTGERKDDHEPHN